MLSKKANTKIICAYGAEREKELLPLLEAHFNTPLKQRPKYDHFDFSNDEEKILVELKSRRFNHDKYPTTIVGFKKVAYGLNAIKDGFVVYFSFAFLDGVYYWQLTPEAQLKCEVRKFSDRYNKPQDYLFISIEDLTRIEPKKVAVVDTISELFEGLRLDFDCFKIDWSEGDPRVSADRIKSAGWRLEQKIDSLENTLKTVRSMIKQRVSTASELTPEPESEPEAGEPEPEYDSKFLSEWGF